MESGILRNCLIFLIVCFSVITSCTTESLEQNQTFRDEYNIKKIPWSELSGIIAYDYFSDTCFPPCLGIIDIATRSDQIIRVRSDYLEQGVELHTLTWAHQPNTLTFVSQYPPDSEQYRLFNVDLNGNTELIFNSYPDSTFIFIGAPAWSPDGRIAYMVNTDIDHLNGLWVDHKPFILNQTDHENPLNHRFFINDRVAWAPDGKSFIASVTNNRGYSALWSINNNGDFTVLIEAESDPDYPVLFRHPIYSPDGSKIAFSARMSDDYEHKVWVIKSDGSGLRSPANREGWYPAWSPDGRYLLFTGFRHGISTSLYLVSVEGGKLIRMTPDNAHSTWWASWRP
jgi:Tol biopolymer transport system component